MTNLDDLAAFASLDPQNMLSQIDVLPDQLAAAWGLGASLKLPAWQGIRQVLIAGMGGSAIGADLLAAYAAPGCRVPIYVHRDYGLPAWASGPETLILASSHSGNTEETLSAFNLALARGCRGLVITTGGELASLAAAHAQPAWRFEHRGQPRAAVGFSFGLALAALTRLELLPDPAAELNGAIAAMRDQQEMIRAKSPVRRNPAKRMAGQLLGRSILIMGSGVLASVARRWKGQINEIPKALAQFEYLPEADHNTLAGILNPQDLLPHTFVVFLRAPSDHPLNRLRSDLTRKMFMLEGFSTDFVDAVGETSLANLWTCLHFGDYVAYYLAIAYRVDPTPITVIENFKRELRLAVEQKGEHGRTGA